MNLFNTIKVYPDSWDESDCRDFTAEEIAEVASAKVVDSNFGQSVCMVMKAGGKAFIPVDNSSVVATGSIVDLSKVKIVTLSKRGEKDIYRIRF